MNVRFSISPENSETLEKNVCAGGGVKQRGSTHASPPHTHRRVRIETRMSYVSRDAGKQNHQTLRGEWKMLGNEWQFPQKLHINYHKIQHLHIYPREIKTYARGKIYKGVLVSLLFIIVKELETQCYQIICALIKSGAFRRRNTI